MSSEGHPQKEPVVWARQRDPTVGRSRTLPRRAPFRLTGATISIDERQQLRQYSLGHSPNHVLLMPKDARIDLNRTSAYRTGLP